MSIRKSFCMLATVFALATFLSVPIAKGQQQGQGSGLQVSPTRSDLVIQPGEQKQFKVTLRNITQADLKAQAFLNDFQSDDTSGTPQIIVEENKRTPYTLVNMITKVESVPLKAGEVKEIIVNVNVPVTTAPGAYFGALRYAAVPTGLSQEEADRQVALTASVAHLVFIEVPGDITEQIQIDNLKAQYNNKPSTFFFKKPNQSALTVKNLGNGFSRPFGKVTMDAPFKKNAHTYEVNKTDPRGIILPKSSRSFTDELKNINMPGKYTLTASIAYGNGGEVISYKSSFIYMPLWVIAVILLLIIAIAIFVYRIYKSRYSGASSIRGSFGNRNKY